MNWKIASWRSVLNMAKEVKACSIVYLRQQQRQLAGHRNRNLVFFRVVVPCPCSSRKTSVIDSHVYYAKKNGSWILSSVHVPSPTTLKFFLTPKSHLLSFIQHKFSPIITESLSHHISTFTHYLYHILMQYWVSFIAIMFILS